MKLLLFSQSKVTSNSPAAAIVTDFAIVNPVFAAPVYVPSLITVMVSPSVATARAASKVG